MPSMGIIKLVPGLSWRACKKLALGFFTFSHLLTFDMPFNWLKKFLKKPCRWLLVHQKSFNFDLVLTFLLFGSVKLEYFHWKGSCWVASIETTASIFKLLHGCPTHLHHSRVEKKKPNQFWQSLRIHLNWQKVRAVVYYPLFKPTKESVACHTQGQGSASDLKFLCCSGCCTQVQYWIYVGFLQKLHVLELWRTYSVSNLYILLLQKY